MFLQNLSELQYSGVGRNKEQAARMLGHLVANTARLIKPYMEPILKVNLSLMWKLKIIILSGKKTTHFFF